jgi:S-formylglutathione hydrolase FrmB
VDGESGSGRSADSYVTVLPRGYRAHPKKRYPVIYLLHGRTVPAQEYLACLRLLELSAGDQAIVVLPQGTPNGFWIDWHDGRELRETALLKMVRAVDRRFRTMPRRSSRAIGGISMGGYGAMVQAARHPRLFGAVASFSGALGSAEPNLPRALIAWAVTNAFAPGAFASPLSPSGPGWRRAHDPISLAPRLRGKALFLSAATGIPCDSDEIGRFSESPLQPHFEGLVRQDQDAMHTALNVAGIPHTYRTYDCGAHTYPVFQRELEAAWPMLLRAVGAA